MLAERVQGLWKEDLRKLKAGTIRLCRICEKEGHNARECPNLGKEVWCKICGDDLHIDKYCNKDKKECGRCGQKDNHHSVLHWTKDLHKRLFLLKENGDNFSHFIQATGSDKPGESVEERKDLGNIGASGSGTATSKRKDFGRTKQESWGRAGDTYARGKYKSLGS